MPPPVTPQELESRVQFYRHTIQDSPIRDYLLSDKFIRLTLNVMGPDDPMTRALIAEFNEDFRATAP